MELIPKKDFIIARNPVVDSRIALPQGVSVNTKKYIEVVAVGPDVKDIKVGDKVIVFPPNAAVILQFDDGYKPIIIKEDNIVAVMKEDVE